MVSDTRATHEHIYSEYYPKILWYIRGKVQNAEDAEDLTQMVFLKVLERWDSFDENYNFSTWVYAIARNAVIDFYRTHHVHSDIEELPDLPSDDEGILSGLLLEERQAQLAKALTRLSQEERDLIILHYYDNRSLSRIAEDMRRPYGQIKRLHQKALARLEVEMR